METLLTQRRSVAIFEAFTMMRSAVTSTTPEAFACTNADGTDIVAADLFSKTLGSRWYLERKC